MGKPQVCKDYADVMSQLKIILLDDPNSIKAQLVFASRHLRIFKLIDWCSKQEKSCFRNRDLEVFSLMGFVTTHAIYIGGLSNGSQTNEISLKNALRLLEKNKGLFTRKNYVCFGEIPFDYEEQIQKEQQELLQRNTSEIYEISKAEKSKKRHEKFNILSNVDEKKGERNLIGDSFFLKIKAELKNCKTTDEFANNCIAHRQIEEIRLKQSKGNKFDIDIKSLEEGYDSLWKVFNTLHYFFFDKSQDPVQIVNDQFLHIDMPMVDKSKIEEYESLMKSLEKKDTKIHAKLMDFAEASLAKNLNRVF